MSSPDEKSHSLSLSRLVDDRSENLLSKCYKRSNCSLECQRRLEWIVSESSSTWLVKNILSLPAIFFSLVPTPFPRSTFDDEDRWSSQFSTWASEDPSSMSDESSTRPTNVDSSRRRSFSLLDRSNFGWFLSLITSFCLLVILGTFAFGVWSTRRAHLYNLHLPLKSRIAFLARRSLRSSTRSEKNLANVSEIASELRKDDSPSEQLDRISSESNVSSTTATSYYTYL